MEKDRLLRFISNSKEFDSLKIKGKRGFYVCVDCINKERVRAKMDIDKNDLIKKLEKNIINLIQLGYRSGQVFIGFESLEKLTKNKEKGFIIIATDIAERTKRHIFRVFKGDCYKLFTKEELGKFLGKKIVGVLFVKETKFGLKLKNLVEQFLQLKGGSSSCQ